MKKYSRPLLLPDGKGTKYVLLDECICGNRRGPEGGVCGCGDAIPSKKEKQPAASSLEGNNAGNTIQ